MGEVGEVVDMLKTYVGQEVVDPLKSIPGKLAKGAAGALLIGLGLFFLSLGLLRLIQDKWHRLDRGAWSSAPYGIVLIFAVVVSIVAVQRITKIKKELN